MSGAVPSAVGGGSAVNGAVGGGGPGAVSPPPHSPVLSTAAAGAHIEFKGAYSCEAL